MGLNGENESGGGKYPSHRPNGNGRRNQKNQQNQQSRQNRRNRGTGRHQPARVPVSVRDLLEQYISKNKRLQYEVKIREAVEAWSRINTGYIQRHSAAALVKDRTLYVHTDSTALTGELTLREEELRGSLNRELGVQLIEKIVFTSGQLSHGNHKKTRDGGAGSGAPKKLTVGTLDRIDRAVRHIEEEELREIMKKFLKSSALRNIRDGKT